MDRYTYMYTGDGWMGRWIDTHMCTHCKKMQKGKMVV